MYKINYFKDRFIFGSYRQQDSTGHYRQIRQQKNRKPQWKETICSKNKYRQIYFDSNKFYLNNNFRDFPSETFLPKTDAMSFDAMAFENNLKVHTSVHII